MATSIWDFQEQYQTPVNGGTTQTSSTTDTVSSWLDILGNTATKYVEVKNALDNPTANNTATQQTYENIQQGVNQSSITSTLSSNKNMFIYGGVALVGAYLLFKGGK